MSNGLYDYELKAGVDLPAVALEKYACSGRENDHAGLAGPLHRRQFMKLTGIAGGGLVLAYFLGGQSSARAAEARGSREVAEFAPNGFVQIKPDGTVILAAHVPEVGQGVKTAMPMIVAEELEVPWDAVTVQQSKISNEVYGRQAAGGSGATPDAWDRLRQAGAMARTMLVAAAAQTWSVAESECRASDGKVLHEGTGRTLSYGELASKAAELPVPAADKVQLKPRSEYKLLGKFVTGVDNHALVTGQPLFALDQRLPGMLFAVYVKCPRFRGEAQRANLDEVKRLPGVVDAFIVEGNGNPMELSGGVAIVARSTHQAFQAEKALQVVWNTDGASDESWSSLQAQAKELTAKEGPRLDDWGDFDQAQAEADKVVESYYSYPYLSHAQLEPHNCTAWLHDGKLEMWIPSQTPQSVPGLAAAIAGIDPSDVILHQMRIGGGFGRRLINDFAAEVAAIAKRIDAPVQLVSTRESDMAHDFYRVGGFHNLTGCLDAQGRFTGLRNRTVIFVNPDDSDNDPLPGANVRGYQVQCPELPNVRFEATNVPSKVPAGWWRAPASCSLAWVFQSFIHEMATAAGRDHVEFLLEQMGEPRWLGRQRQHDFNTERAINVIKLAAEKGDWGKKLDSGRGRGLSFYFSHRGYFAEVAEVTVSESRNVSIDRVVVAADVGMLLNKGGGENQVEGSVVDAISVLAGQAVTFEGGAVKESNFDDYPLLRMAAQPAIEIHWLTTEYDPTGLGEPAFPPLTAAVTNAIFDATGERIRDMPITKLGFSIS